MAKRSRRAALTKTAVYAAFAACLVMATACGSGSAGGGRAEFGSDEYCIEKADQLVRDYPNVYASRQEAHDGCRRAGDVADELGGEVDRRP
jgi:hypothetical protein